MAGGNGGKPASLNTCSVQDTGSHSEEERMVNNDTCSSLQEFLLYLERTEVGPWKAGSEPWPRPCGSHFGLPL